MTVAEAKRQTRLIKPEEVREHLDMMNLAYVFKKEFLERNIAAKGEIQLGQIIRLFAISTQERPYTPCGDGI